MSVRTAMQIRVLGSGCMNSATLAERTRDAVTALVELLGQAA